MHESGVPAQFLHSLHHTAYEEHRALVVVLGREAYFKVGGCLCAQEVVFVVDEVYLHACGQECGNLDYEWMVGIVNLDIQA